jgi:hypothetical protein
MSTQLLTTYHTLPTYADSIYRGVQKSILERESPPTFDVAVEMVSRERWLIHADVASAVDALLCGRDAGAEVRERGPDGRIWSFPEGETTDYEDDSDAEREDAAAALATAVQRVPSRRSPSSSSGSGSGQSSSSGSRRVGVETQPFPPEALAAARTRHSFAAGAAARPDALQVYLYGVSGDDVASVAQALRMGDAVAVADKLEDADAVLATRQKLKSSTWIKNGAKAAGIPIYSIRDASIEHIVRAVRTVLGVDPSPGSMFAPSGAQDAPAKGMCVAISTRVAGFTRCNDAVFTDAADPRVASARTQRAETSIDLVKRQAGRATSTPLPKRGSGAEREALDEARTVAEEIVLRQGQPAELMPRDPALLERQAALLDGMGLSWEIAGGEGAGGRRLRVLPVGYVASRPEDVAAPVVGGARQKEYW